MYCLKYNIGVGREHVIPFGLGHGLILRKSSCKRHACITGNNEGIALGMAQGMGAFRYRYKMPIQNKRKKEKMRSVVAPIELDYGTFSEKKLIGAALYPAFLHGSIPCRMCIY